MNTYLLMMYFLTYPPPPFLFSFQDRPHATGKCVPVVREGAV